VLGNQCVLQFGATAAGLALWVVGVLFWLALTYVMLPGLMEAQAKPKLAEGLNGPWLLVVVGTQAVSVLATLLVPAFAADAPEGPLFVALAFWLVGSMLYVRLIAFIFHCILFLPLSPGDLTPPYWINMGAMAISTLAGARLVGEAGRSPLLADLLPFLKGTTLLFLATATWWIPILLALGAWRHLFARPADLRARLLGCGLPARHVHGVHPDRHPRVLASVPRAHRGGVRLGRAGSLGAHVRRPRSLRLAGASVATAGPGLIRQVGCGALIPCPRRQRQRRQHTIRVACRRERPALRLLEAGVTPLIADPPPVCSRVPPPGPVSLSRRGWRPGGTVRHG